eukprot:jgi/Tetstr1/438645/TSEL_027196.t1
MEQALHLRQRLASLLDALGLQRNPTKGFWEPCQFGRRMGVDIDSASGMLYAPADKLADRLSGQATRPRHVERQAWGFWCSADERQHITWKELKAVRLAVESFLPHLAGRNVLMHEDN